MTDNTAMIDYWQTQGTVWVDAQERMDRMLAPLTTALVAAAGLSATDRVIDVGCGCGDTTLMLAAQAASVRGIDVSAPMLARAQERVSQAGLSNVTLMLEDAASADYSAGFDLLFSRFGVMFFADPEAAFTHMRTALVPGGRLCFLCWQPPRRNPWMALVGAAIAHLLPEPETPPDPKEPGPFAFADPDYMRGFLGAAGYANVEITPVTETLHLADTVDDALARLAEIGPLARALKELEGAPREEALTIARRTLEAELRPDGLRLGAACWLVHATA
ncbi:MAG: class I SAM-dependent methyltransferase [Pseudomonadota bacterium]